MVMRKRRLDDKRERRIKTCKLIGKCMVYALIADGMQKLRSGNFSISGKKCAQTVAHKKADGKEKSPDKNVCR